MKYFVTVAALLVMLLPMSVSAQEGGSVKTKFYNFDDLLIDGQYQKPKVLYTDARQKVKFERLLALKKDFLPKLKAKAKDAALR